MDREESDLTRFQDVIRCDVCHTATAHAHCDTCRVYICGRCLSPHCLSDMTKQHQIVDCKKRSKFKLTECKSHSNRRCELHCIHCDVPVCSKCMASGHKMHPVLDIVEVCVSKQSEISHDYKEIKTSIIPQLENARSQLIDKNVLSLKFDEISADINKHRQEWHSNIDRIVNRLITDVGKTKVTQLTLLKQLQSDLDEMISLAQEIMKHNAKLLQSNEVSEFTKYTSRLQDLGNIPETPKVALSSFTPLKIEENTILHMFGSLELGVGASNITSKDITSDQKGACKLQKPEVARHECLFCEKIVGLEYLWLALKAENCEDCIFSRRLVFECACGKQQYRCSQCYKSLKLRKILF